MTFGDAVNALKQGSKVSREGWNGKGMWLKLTRSGRAGIEGPGSTPQDIQVEPHILMFTAQKNYVPWLASQSDVLAEDWTVLPT